MAVDRTEAQPSAGVVAARRPMVMLTAMLASGMYTLDLTIVSIALPHMRGTFAAAPDQIAWVVTAFIVGVTMTTVCAGWLSARFGRKRLFILSVAGFAAASVMCANAQTVEEAILWRFLQGLAGAPLMPLSQAIAIDAYPPRDYAKALGLWTVGGMMGPMIAPALGGYITQAYGWPGVFYLNLPLGILTLLGALAFVPRERADASRRMNWLGFSALVLGLGAVQLMLSRGARLDWLGSTEIVVELVAGALCLYLFLADMLLARRPFVPRALFGDGNYLLGLFINLVFGSLIFLPVVLLPLMLEGLRGFPVDTIGLLFVPRAFGVAASSLLVGWLLARVKPRSLAVLGFLGMAFSTWLMAGWTFEVGPWEVAWVGFLHGSASSFVFMPVNVVAFSTLAMRYRSEALPFFYLAFNLGASLGIAGIATFWAGEAQTYHALLAEHITPFHQASQMEVWKPDIPEGLAALDSEVTRQAEMIAYNNSFYLMAAAALASVPLAFVLRTPRLARARSSKISTNR